MSQARSSASERPLIALEGAQKRYGRRLVLDVERLELHRKDWLLVTGSNGSGKSTLLRVLSGVASLSAGRVVRAPEFEQLRLAYVPQSAALYQHLTITDNMNLWARLLGAAETGGLAARWYVREFGLVPYLDSPLRELSGGFQRLATIACALVARPQGLFLDEPLTGIDGHYGEALIRGIEAVTAELEFIVMTSHSADGFPARCRVTLLRSGVPS